MVLQLHLNSATVLLTDDVMNVLWPLAFLLNEKPFFSLFSIYLLFDDLGVKLKVVCNRNSNHSHLWKMIW